MPPTDPLPALLRAFVQAPESPAASALLALVHRSVQRVARPYPAAYFALGRKCAESIEDLGHRVFTVCARVEKGRYPFSGRAPFAAYLEEGMDGREVRYHSFSAKISITRELLRDDYAHNIVRDPLLRWRAALHAALGAALRAAAEAGTLAPRPAGRGRPPQWAPVAPGLRPLLAPPALVELLQDTVREAISAASSAPPGPPAAGDPVPTTPLPPAAALAAFVETAVVRGGPRSHAQLTTLAETVLGPPALPAPAAPAPPVDLPTQLALRSAVAAAWAELDAADQALLAAIARGDDYDSLVAREPRFSGKVAVSRAVKRCGDLFVARILDELGIPPGARRAPPRSLVEAVMAVLEEVLPQGPLAAAGGA